MFHDVHVIVNPASGSEEAPLEAIRDALDAAGLRWCLHTTGETLRARHLARQSAEDGADVVVACGGDGTVTEVAQGLLGTGVPMAIIPQGTANVFASELGLPHAPEAALALVTGPHGRRRLDMGCVEDGCFLLRLGVGLEAAMTVWAPPELKGRWGRWAYVVTAARLRRRLRPVRYRLTLDGVDRETRGISCLVCNSGNLGLPGFQLLPEIDPADGILNVVVVRHGSLRAVLQIGWEVLRGLLPGHREAPVPRHSYAFDTWPAREAAVTAEPAQVVARDGEEVETPFPLRARVVPGALEVVVPAGEG